MARNRFEQVDEVQPDAITLSFRKSGNEESGIVYVPASATQGRSPIDHVSESMPAVDCFRSSIKLANEMKLAIVVMDPDGVWKPEWGDLYREAEPADESP